MFSEETLRTILNRVHDAVFVHDIEGRLLYVNETMLRMYRVTAEEALTLSIVHDYSASNMAGEPLDSIWQRVAAGEPQLFEWRARRPHDGSAFDVEVFLTKVALPGGDVILATVRDITERKRAEQAMRESAQLALRNQEVEKANRLKSEFLASMSHELRTPLHSIIGFSELLAEESSGELNRKQKRQLEHILRGARHLLSLINDILDLSRIEAGRLELNLEDFGVDLATREVLTTIEPMAALKQIRVANNVDANEICADRLRFKQILFNLLTNAVKFTPDGGSISISGALRQDFIEFAVVDTGIGIAPEEQAAIFDEFHQASPSTRGVKEGTGLGLAITRRLIEAQGGAISVSSAPGKGSCFTFHLPLRTRVAHPAAEPKPKEALPDWLNHAVTEPLDAPGASAARETSEVRVVVADDSVHSREFIRDALASSNYVVFEACDGNDAVQKVRAVQPHVVLLDIQMPGLNGYEVLGKIRQQPGRLSGLPVVAITAFAMESDRRKAMAAGFDGYLSKPVDPASLRQTIAQLLGR